MSSVNDGFQNINEYEDKYKDILKKFITIKNEPTEFRDYIIRISKELTNKGIDSEFRVYNF